MRHSSPIFVLFSALDGIASLRCFLAGWKTKMHPILPPGLGHRFQWCWERGTPWGSFKFWYWTLSHQVLPDHFQQNTGKYSSAPVSTDGIPKSTIISPILLSACTSKLTNGGLFVTKYTNNTSVDLLYPRTHSPPDNPFKCKGLSFLSPEVFWMHLCCWVIVWRQSGKIKPHKATVSQLSRDYNRSQCVLIQSHCICF